MIELIGAISLFLLVINMLMYRRITATFSLGTVEELKPATYHCCCEVIIGYLESSNQEVSQDILPVAKSTATYSAWKNQKEIPWAPPVKPPEPIVQTPNRGPLARPDGFI